MTATTALDPDWVPEYEKQRDLLWRELVELRSLVFVLERVAEFPFHLFSDIGRGPFWGLVIRSMETTLVVGLWRIIYDTDPNVLTIRKFRRDIMRHATPTSKQAIADKLREDGFMKRLGKAEEGVKHLRHKFYAHLDRSRLTNDQDVSPILARSDVRMVLDSADKVFNSLAFEKQYLTSLYYRDSPLILSSTNDTPPDIERILDGIALGCPDLHMPEEDPDLFPHYWKSRSESDQALFNLYRRKFGLSEIP